MIVEDEVELCVDDILGTMLTVTGICMEDYLKDRIIQLLIDIGVDV